MVLAGGGYRGEGLRGRGLDDRKEVGRRQVSAGCRRSRGPQMGCSSAGRLTAGQSQTIGRDGGRTCGHPPGPSGPLVVPPARRGHRGHPSAQDSSALYQIVQLGFEPGTFQSGGVCYDVAFWTSFWKTFGKLLVNASGSSPKSQQISKNIFEKIMGLSLQTTGTSIPVRRRGRDGPCVPRSIPVSPREGFSSGARLVTSSGQPSARGRGRGRHLRNQQRLPLRCACAVRVLRGRADTNEGIASEGREHGPRGAHPLGLRVKAGDRHHRVGDWQVGAELLLGAVLGDRPEPFEQGAQDLLHLDTQSVRACGADRGREGDTQHAKSADKSRRDSRIGQREGTERKRWRGGTGGRVENCSKGGERSV